MIFFNVLQCFISVFSSFAVVEGNLKIIAERVRCCLPQFKLGCLKKKVNSAPPPSAVLFVLWETHPASQVGP